MTESVYERVKKRAYEIWEEEGRPWGRDSVHWEQAHREIATAALAPIASGADIVQDTPPKATPVKTKAPAKNRTKKATV